jgi:hypothetical protein
VPCVTIPVFRGHPAKDRLSRLPVLAKGFVFLERVSAFLLSCWKHSGDNQVFDLEANDSSTQTTGCPSSP